MSETPAPQGQDKAAEPPEMETTVDLIHALTAQLNDSTETTKVLAAALEAWHASKIELAGHLDKVGNVAADAVFRADKAEAENARLRHDLDIILQMASGDVAEVARAALAEPGS